MEAKGIDVVVDALMDGLIVKSEYDSSMVIRAVHYEETNTIDIFKKLVEEKFMERVVKNVNPALLGFVLEYLTDMKDTADRMQMCYSMIVTKWGNSYAKMVEYSMDDEERMLFAGRMIRRNAEERDWWIAARIAYEHLRDMVMDMIAGQGDGVYFLPDKDKGDKRNDGSKD